MNRIIRMLGVDKAIRYVIFGKIISVLTGLLLIMLISHHLSKDAQGYYYTFNSVVALQIIFELGLSTVIIQFASHEMSALKYDYSERDIIGESKNKQRYLSLFRLAIKWYAVIALLIILIVGPIGYVFFTQKEGLGVPWQGAWLLLTIVTAFNIFLVSVLSVAEGSGLITDVNKMRMYQSLLAGILAVSLLISGFGLYATSAIAISGTIIFSIFSYKYFKKIFLQSLKHKNKYTEGGISWVNEIFPMQWRIALSWMSGYFIYFVMTPIAFKYFGAIYAGQLGMSLTLCNMVMATGLAWISTKYPKWGVMVSNKQLAELSKSFKSAVMQSSFFVLTGLTGVYISLWLLKLSGSNIGERFLGLQDFFFLSLAIIGNHIVACFATYIRAHKTEKMTLASCIMALLTITTMLFVAYLEYSRFYMLMYAALTW
ncbi:hypothetical protein LCB16_003992, partial [Salmonella enterica subsp. enterica serovar Newport]|nr:hypothetical protein [Salmonella enterica]EGF5740865.1 hypothetical protein [Salmonella enterica]EID6897548.1 hypothetical protein [Salmonella enterica subsp. enterica serovar Newport]